MQVKIHLTAPSLARIRSFDSQDTKKVSVEGSVSSASAEPYLRVRAHSFSVSFSLGNHHDRASDL